MVSLVRPFTTGHADAENRPAAIVRQVRFIHTSDVHLDTSFAGSGFPSRLGDRKREAIRSTFRRILEEARRQAVDLVLIAGDLFEHDRVTPDTVEFLKQQFETLAGIRVFISPGNHDPYLQGSPYHDQRWPDNVHIFRHEEFRPVELPDLGVRVTGFGFNRTQLAVHHFAQLKPLPDGQVNLVLAHGSDLGRVPVGKSKHGPLTIDEIAGKNIQYCALGHYHEQRQIYNPIDDTQVWYSGIPEGRGWYEEGTCAYLLGEIREDRQVRVQGIACNQYPLRTITIDCENFSTREQVIDAILEHRGTDFDSRTLLRIRLVGSPDQRLDLSTGEMAERLADEALYIQWKNETIPALDFQALAQENTLCGRFVRAMNQRIGASDEDEREMLELARVYGVQALLGRDLIRLTIDD